MMKANETKKKLIGLIEPLVEDKGFELVQLDYTPGKQGHLLLYIDQEEGISIEECELVSRAVSDMLDSHDPIVHSYTLEVSSPGLERPLTKPAHFIRFQGKKVKVKTVEPLEGSRNFSGTLVKADDSSITISKNEGTEVQMPYSAIARARLCYTGPDNDNCE